MILEVVRVSFEVNFSLWVCLPVCLLICLKGLSFYRNCVAASVGEYKKIILVLATDLIMYNGHQWIFKADFSSVCPSSERSLFVCLSNLFYLPLHKTLMLQYFWLLTCTRTSRYRPSLLSIKHSYTKYKQLSLIFSTGPREPVPKIAKKGELFKPVAC